MASIELKFGRVVERSHGTDIPDTFTGEYVFMKKPLSFHLLKSSILKTVCICERAVATSRCDCYQRDYSIRRLRALAVIRRCLERLSKGVIRSRKIALCRSRLHTNVL